MVVRHEELGRAERVDVVGSDNEGVVDRLEVCGARVRDGDTEDLDGGIGFMRSVGGRLVVHRMEVEAVR